MKTNTNIQSNSTKKNAPAFKLGTSTRDAVNKAQSPGRCHLSLSSPPPFPSLPHHPRFASPVFIFLHIS